MAVWRFGEFDLDVENFELRQQGQSRVVQPTPLRLLIYLVTNRDRVVPKEEILRAVWPDAEVTEASIHRAVRVLRRLLDDRRVQPIFIRTVNRTGYQFICACRPADNGLPPVSRDPISGSIAGSE